MTVPSPINQVSRARIWRRARDHFLLEDVERQVRSRILEQQASLGRYYRAAARRAAVADDLADSHSMASSMVLYRDAMRLFIAAVVKAHNVAADPRVMLADGDSPWEALAELSRRAVIAELPREVEAARKILSAAHEPLVFDEMAPGELLAQRTTVREAVAWLRALVDPRTLRRIRTERRLRVSMLGIVAVAVLAYVASSLVVPTNLALHKPVSASSRHPLSVAAEDNSGVVNGHIESTYGIQTNVGGGWVTVDLLDVYQLSKVKIFNRADGWLDGGLPMRLELSEDGKQWREAQRRTTTFTASNPWVFSGQGVRARFVRVASDSYVALTEIEVFGKR